MRLRVTACVSFYFSRVSPSDKKISKAYEDCGSKVRQLQRVLICIQEQILKLEVAVADSDALKVRHRV